MHCCYFNILKFIIVLIFLIKCNALYDGQPKIISKNGNIIIESAKDKNITFRTVGIGRILANNVDLTSNQLIKTPLDINRFPIHYDLKDLEDEKKIKRILIGVLLNITSLNNVTFQQGIKIRRIDNTLNRIMRQQNRLIVNLATNNCKDQPCSNGGTCIPTYNSFMCQCPTNWQGRLCQTDVNECEQFVKAPHLGCQNDAWCENTPGGYSCRCKGGFFGTHCTEKENDCLKSSHRELCDHGTCVNTKSGVNCVCDQGWKKNEATGSCSVDINECETNVNPCHSVCINLPGTFYCGPCPPGFTGNGFVCKDIDECQINNGGCSARAQCINTIGSVHCGQCPPGFIGDGKNCEMTQSTTCELNNPCSLDANCRMISGVPICTCKSGYIGNGYVCSFIINPCSPNPCNSNEICQRTSGTPGYRCMSSSPCATIRCKNGGTCIAKGLTYSCTCPPGYMGKICQIVESSMCNKVLTNDNGLLNIMNYEPDSNCYYIIQTKDSKILNITINEFHLKESNDCLKNFVQFHNGKNSAAPGFGRYCGSKLPMDGQFYTSHNFLYIWFKTDSTPSNQSLGFKLQWISIDPICGGELSYENSLKTAGVITSPGWPNLSPPNRDCSWNFLAPNGKKLAFRILEIKLGGTESECSDYFEIRNGDIKTKFCSSSITPSTFETTSNVAEVNFHTDKYLTDSSFQVHYEIIEGVPNCGGIFEKTIGIIQSPKSSELTFKQITCQYLIRQPIGTQIQLNFEVFELPGLYNCSTVSLEIYDGNNENSPLLLRKCNSDTINPITSTDNSLMLRYKYFDGFLHSVYNGFKAQYKLTCSKNLNNDLGVITSPGYPNSYVDSFSCIYEIQAPLNHIISLSTIEFSLSNRKNIDCDIEVDNVEIFTNFQNSTRYCQQPEPIILSEKNYMKIVFNSVKNFDNAKGFKFSYKFEDIGCGGVIKNSNGTISTINTRMSNRFCEWIIMAPSGSNIGLKYGEILYSNNVDTNCDNGVIQFENYTQGEIIKTEICKINQAKDNLISSAGIITIVQKLTRNLRYDEGFRLEYIMSDTICGGMLTGNYGEIKSPGYPNDYPNNIDCTWVINVPDGHQIELKSMNFSLELISDNCVEDYLEIRNGKTEVSSLIGKFCGTNFPSSIPSQANHLYLHFHSDYSIRMPGFHLIYEQTATGCGGNVDSFEGSIHSPHYPDIPFGGALCNWMITVSAGSTISATVTLEANTIDICDKNKLLIFDGDSVKYKKIPLYCNVGNTSMVSIQMINSSTNKLYIRFETTSEEPARFFLTYTTNCTITLTEFQGQIESPNFPNNYPNNLLCEWIIASKKSKSITLVVSHLQLEGSISDCFYDHLTITELKNNNSIKSYTLCSEKTKTIVSESDSIKVEFKTDYSNSERGFRIEYYIEGCGEYLTKDSGQLVSLNKPYSNNLHCKWTIEADYGYVIQLNVLSNIGLDNCDWINEGLLISNDKLGNQVITKSCSANRFKVVSTGRFIYINYITNDFHKQKYFEAEYSIRKQGCGGQYHVEIDEIHISSPQYPQAYPPESDCEWLVSSNYNKRIQLELQFNDIEESENCTKDYLDIYDSFYRNFNERSLRLCSDVTPNITRFNSTYNRMMVAFHSDNSTEKHGFDIVAKRLCGAIYENATYGAIRKIPNEKNCFWSIKSKNNIQINLRFSNLVCVCDNESEDSCEKYKGVQIYEDKILRASFCKNHSPTLTSTGDSFKIYAGDGVKSMFALYSSITNLCSGRYISIRGKFASPQYPNFYKSGHECVIRIIASKGNMIQLEFSEFDLIKSDHCHEDYVEIRQDDSAGKLLDVLCGNNIENKIYDIYETAWIKFRSSENSLGAKGYLARYNYKRDVEILTENVGNKGVISNPPVESLINDFTPFTWRVITDFGKRIRFNFKEYRQGLELRDGFDDSAELINIQHSPYTFVSSSNFAFIKTDNANLQHFKIEWQNIDKNDVPTNETKCGDVIDVFPNEQKNFSSPNYPKSYDSNTHCEWIFKSNSNTDHVAISLYAANLESLQSCFGDYLKIYTGEELAIWKEENISCNLTYKSVPYFTIQGTPYLKLVFHSDSYTEGSGFTTIISSKCGGVLTQPSGIFDANNMRPDDTSCSWKIKVQRGRKIEFKFEFDYDAKYSIEQNTACSNAYALLRDGIDEDAPIISPGRICSETALEDVQLITKSNYGHVKFTVKPGQKIKWKLVYQEYNECGDQIHLTKNSNTTTIKTPNYPKIPHPYAECIWTITSPPASTITLKFTEYVTHNNKINCNNEYILVRDGSTNLAPQIGRFCRKPYMKTITQSSGNTMWFKYSANTSEPQNTFVANVSIAKCFTVVQGYYAGEIKSLNYPAKGGYPANSECVYAIKSSLIFRVNLTILDLHLPFNSSNLNINDHVEIISDDGNNNKDTILIYGNDTRKYLELFGNVKIKFITYKAQTEYRGFKFTYKRFNSCFKDIHAEEGELVARKPNRRFFSCRWQITVPKGRIVRVRLTDLEMTDTQTRSGHKIRFYNDFRGRSRIIELTNTTIDLINSTDNRMLIRLDGGFPSQVLSIKFKFDSYDTSNCFGDFELSLNEERSYYISNIKFPPQYYCVSNFMSLSGVQTYGLHIENLLLTATNGILAPINFVVGMSNYKSIMENLTNYDVAINRQDSFLEIQSSEAFKIFDFQISIKKHNCGRSYDIYIGNTIYIELPNNLGSNYGRIDCAWTINANYAPKNLTFITNFTNSDCSKEYLTIYNGRFASDVLVKKLCGNLTFNFMADNKNLLLHYHSDDFTSKSKIIVTSTFVRNCGGVILPSVRGSVIKFGRSDYDNNLECFWDYRGKEGFSVSLEFFGRFFIPSNPNCTDDYLEIKRLSLDNTWITYPRLCGRELPNLINSTSSVYNIKFRSDNKTIGDGFSVRFKESCGGIYNATDKIQTIRNAADWFTTRYQIKCNYSLVTETNKYIVVKFNKFQIGSGSRDDCYYSKFSLFYEKDYEVKKIGEYCQKNPLTEIKQKNLLTIVYQSQLYSDEYSFDYYLEDCGGNITEPTKIHSPYGPDGEKYPTDMECRWDIKAPLDKDIAIRFNYFIYENQHQCQDDYVAIFNSTEPKTKYRKILMCGNHTGKQLPTVKTSNNAVIITKSDSYVSYEGFSAEISFITKCDKFINLTGTFSSHIEFNYYFNNGKYENNLDCQISVTTNKGFQISIEFMDFDVKEECTLQIPNSNSTEKCKCDYLEIFDGSTTYENSLGKYCGNQLPKTIQSSKQDLTLRFFTDASNGGAGFKFEIKKVPNICGVKSIDFIETKPVTLTSPNYPRYPPNAYCEWIIKTNESFLIKFDVFELENQNSETGMCNDYLEVVRPFSMSYGTNEQDLVYCSNNTPISLNIYVSPYNPAPPKIIFRSNNEIEKRGFKLTLTDTGICNITHAEKSGFLEQALNSKCNFNIEIEEHKTIALYFNIRSSNYQSEDECTQKIKISDTKSNQLLKHFCLKKTYSSTYQAFLKTNKVKIELDLRDEINMELFYMGNTNGLGCGGELNGFNGIVSSPMYPDNFRNYSDCQWIVTVPMRSIISAYFKDFDMGSKKNCDKDYVQFIAVYPNRQQIFAQYCGGDDPAHFEIDTNKMIVIYKRTVNFDGKGWILSYETTSKYIQKRIIT